MALGVQFLAMGEGVHFLSEKSMSWQQFPKGRLTSISGEHEAIRSKQPYRASTEYDKRVHPHVDRVGAGVMPRYKR